MALAIAHYYWTRGNSDVMPRFPVLHAARTTLRWSILTTPKHNTLFAMLSVSGLAQLLLVVSVIGPRLFASRLKGGMWDAWLLKATLASPFGSRSALVVGAAVHVLVSRAGT